MNLVIDIGNTCTKFVCFDGDNVVSEVRSDKGEYDKLLRLCSDYHFEKGICAAVSHTSSEFNHVLDSLPFPVLRFESGVTPVPIINKYKTPHTLGADRLAAAVGANYMQPGRDVLIIDVGTCITFDFVNSSGEYLGGNISPGPTMRLKAFHEFTSKLPLIERRGKVSELGDTTELALRNGVYHGVRYEIEGYITEFLRKYPQLFVYLTGGVHLNLHFSEKMPIFADNFIVPRGLNRILEYNNEFL